MLSVGSRDDVSKRSLLELGRSGGAERTKMEENELEEGEAYPGQDDDIDPDALSYIDEKLQNVLGHFQKEFEGGVSAETLGAKFGGYGSFLPAYQRSPPNKLSQSKSPAKAPSHIQSSPHNLQPEAGRHNVSVSTSASVTKVNHTSGGQQIEKNDKRDICISSCSMEPITQLESTRQTLDIRDPKSLKMRIKVGPDNVLLRNKPEIYSDLGLDVSPSPKDSSDGNRELSPESPDVFLESPSTILQVMTHGLVPEIYLLSPLSETLLHLFEKEDTSIIKIKKSTPQKVVGENCAVSSDTYLQTKDCKDFTCLESKSSEKCQVVQTHGVTCEDGATTRLKKETGNKTTAAQNVVVLPSNSSCADVKEDIHLGGNSMKDYYMPDNKNELNKMPMMERVLPIGIRKDDHLELTDCRKTDGTDNLTMDTILSNEKSYSKPHVVQIEEPSRNFNIPGKSKSKTHKNLDKKKSDSDKHRTKKDSTKFVLVNTQAQSTRKAISCEIKAMQGMDQALEDGKMIKGRQNEKLFLEQKKEKQGTLLSAAPNGIKKPLHLKGAHLETKSKISKSHKEIKTDYYTKCPSELPLNAQPQQIENRMIPLDFSSSAEKLDEKAEANKIDNFCNGGSDTDILAPLIDAVPKNEVVSAIPAGVIIEDNWVCCDVCQTWRLLPYGTNPSSLPLKWQCSMQVWLPGLNNCNIGQDEAAKAFHELYQFPAPANDTNVTAHINTASLSITSADNMNPGRKLENATHNTHLVGNKKHRSLDATNLPHDSSLTNLPNSSKNLLVSSRNKAFNDVTFCTETDSLVKPKPTSKFMDFAAEKRVHKQKEKHAVASSVKFEGGDLSERSGKYSKPTSKRAMDTDGHRISKKLKKDGSYHLPKDLHSSIDASGKITDNGDSELLATIPKNILENCSDYSSKNLRSNFGSSKKMPRDNGKPKRIPSASEAEKYDSNDKKRKLKDRHEGQVCQEISMNNVRIAGSRITSKDELIDRDMRRQKKAKLLKSEGKESRGGNSEMNGCSTRIALSSNKEHLPLPSEVDTKALHAATDPTSEQTMDGLDGLKRGVAYMSSLAATTSSSSKVSGSQKGKMNLPETRGSPVESVSSSPMRILSSENNSARKSLLNKDNTISMGYSGMGSPKRYSDGDFDGSSDQSGTRAKDPSSNGCRRSSEIYRSAESGALHTSLQSHEYKVTETRSLSAIKAIDGRQSKFVKRDVAISTDIGKTNISYDSRSMPYHPKKCHLERFDRNHTGDEDELVTSSQKNYAKSSLHFRENHRSLNSEKVKLKVFDKDMEHKDLHPTRACNNRPADTEFDNLKSKKGILENHYKQHKARDLRTTIAGETRSRPTSQKTTSDLLSTEAINRSVVDLGKGKQLPNQSKDQLEKRLLTPQRALESTKAGNLEKLPVDTVNGETSKTAKTSRKLDEQNGILSNILKQPTTSVPSSSSPMKKDGHSVNTFIKEARDLKHTANRMKSSGNEEESCSIFFESALKFLHAAFLLEPPNTDSTRQGDPIPSTQGLLMYYETAKFCEFCAHEYERMKEMVAAALAYKCAEVAYLKVAYYKNSSASKDRLELQIALDSLMPGESPSSCASDVDNLNNQGGIDKVASTRAVCSPQIVGNHAIAARNRPHIMRLLNYTNYLNCAFEATRKSQNAIAAGSTDLGKSGIDICSARKALDFNFHNVEGLLRLVRLSMNSGIE